MARVETNLGSVLGPTGPTGKTGGTGPTGPSGKLGPTGPTGPEMDYVGTDGITITDTGSLTRSVSLDMDYLYDQMNIFGFELDLDEPDTRSRITYIGRNRNWNPARMNYVLDQFDYGDWGGAMVYQRSAGSITQSGRFNCVRA